MLGGKGVDDLLKWKTAYSPELERRERGETSNKSLENLQLPRQWVKFSLDKGYSR